MNPQAIPVPMGVLLREVAAGHTFKTTLQALQWVGNTMLSTMVMVLASVGALVTAAQLVLLANDLDSDFQGDVTQYPIPAEVIWEDDDVTEEGLIRVQEDSGAELSYYDALEQCFDYIEEATDLSEESMDSCEPLDVWQPVLDAFDYVDPMAATLIKFQIKPMVIDYSKYAIKGDDTAELLKPSDPVVPVKQVPWKQKGFKLSKEKRAELEAGQLFKLNPIGFVAGPKVEIMPGSLYPTPNDQQDPYMVAQPLSDEAKSLMSMGWADGWMPAPVTASY